MLVSAVFLAYCDHEALMPGHWPPRGPILQLRGLRVATVAFSSDVLLQVFCVVFHSFLPRNGHRKIQPQEMNMCDLGFGQLVSGIFKGLVPHCLAATKISRHRK